MKRETAVIVGAGPAGLTAALELLRHSAVRPIVVEADAQVGGISKTINYGGNRMDLGGHRFFSKSDWVMKWWQDILPIEGEGARELTIGYQNQQSRFKSLDGASHPDKVMLVRPRLSRIYYRRRFFDYPLKLSYALLKNLGLQEILRVGTSYGFARVFPRSNEETLEDFLINRFGVRLYETFFRDYTEKVWGVSCREISSEWGAQRIKGLSISKAITHAVRSSISGIRDTAQKNVETSLIERFLYPKYGPGQMWEEVATRVSTSGGEVRLNCRVMDIERTGNTIEAVWVRDIRTGESQRLHCDYLISTMPVKDLITQLRPEQDEVLGWASNLPYRDFMTAGILLRKMRGSTRPSSIPPDNWIYVQEPDVKLGRIQIFNNWSPAMVADPSLVWLGLEYFCKESDELWSMENSAFLEFAAQELEKIGLASRHDMLDGTVVRVPKAYPAYFGEYRNMGRIRQYLDGFSNLYAVGRNGMHRYNNQDHSMLAARAAVECIMGREQTRSEIWAVNAEDEYHEQVRTAA